MSFRRIRTIAVASLLGLSAVLGTAGAAQSAPLEPGTPVTFHDRMDQGFGVVGPGMPEAVRTGLFNLTVKSDPAITTQAYCIEMNVMINPQSDPAKRAELDRWDSFIGTNNFQSNPVIDGVPTRERVSWIALNSYPAVDLDTLAARAGIADLSKEEAITASQAAIWHLTDGLQLTAITGYQGLDDSSQTWLDVKALYDHLLGSANTGSPESWSVADPQVSLDGPTTGVAGTIVGPFTVSTTLPSVSLTVNPAGTVLTDANGAPLGSTFADGDTFHLKLTDAADTTVEISASGAGVNASSAIVRTGPLNPRYSTHQQTVIISDSSKHEVSASHRLTVKEKPREPVEVTVTTQAVPEIQVGEQAHDTAIVNGDVPEGATISFELFKQDGPTATCETPTATTDPVDVPAGTAENLTIDSPAVTIEEAGTYYWVETLKDADGNVLHKGECGAEGETTIVKEKPTEPTKPVETPVEPGETPKEPTPTAPTTPKTPGLASTGVDGEVGLYALAGGITAAIGVALMLLARARRTS